MRARSAKREKRFMVTLIFWLAEGFKWNDTALNGGCRSLGSISDAEFAEQAVDVCFDGGFGNVEERGDFLVAQAVDDLFEDVELTWSQFFSAHALGESLGNGGRNMGFAGVDGA